MLVLVWLNGQEFQMILRILMVMLFALVLSMDKERRLCQILQSQEQGPR